jgi:hypothetical protein
VIIGGPLFWVLGGPRPIDFPIRIVGCLLVWAGKFQQKLDSNVQHSASINNPFPLLLNPHPNNKN